MMCNIGLRLEQFIALAISSSIGTSVCASGENQRNQRFRQKNHKNQINHAKITVQTKKPKLFSKKFGYFDFFC